MATLKIPHIVPPPAKDCERLHKSFHGLGTDEKAIIRILGRRNASQRKKIKEEYQQLYKKSLLDSIISELSGNFKKAVVLWLYDPPERDARLANEAIMSKKESIAQIQVVVEIACASSPHHLVAVRQAYCSLFDSSLEEDIISNVSLPLQKILVSLVSSYRYDKEVVDSSLANMEAAKLREAIAAKKLDDDELLIILGTRNIFQLKQTFQHYKDDYGTSIDMDILGCGKGIVESIMNVIVRCIDSPEKHFAEVVRAAIIGLGTEENSLTRVIVGRAEIDMVGVKSEYLNANKTSLDKAVAGDTSGDYENFLMTLLGANV